MVVKEESGWLGSHLGLGDVVVDFGRTADIFCPRVAGVEGVGFVDRIPAKNGCCSPRVRYRGFAELICGLLRSAQASRCLLRKPLIADSSMHAPLAKLIYDCSDSRHVFMSESRSIDRPTQHWTTSVAQSNATVCVDGFLVSGSCVFVNHQSQSYKDLMNIESRASSSSPLRAACIGDILEPGLRLCRTLQAPGSEGPRRSTGVATFPGRLNRSTSSNKPAEHQDKRLPT